MPEERELTYGEKAVGLTFNPSGDMRVTELKTLYAKIIDICDDLRRILCESGGATGDPDIDRAVTSKIAEQKRLLSIAITEAQGAQMWAVKAITFGL